MVYDSKDKQHVSSIGVAMLWAAALGFPIKLEKSDSGSCVKWIGAMLKVTDTEKSVTVTIPQVSQKVKTALSRPVIGRKKLQSLAGALSFVVPHMRPFLGGLWAVLATTNDGTTHSPHSLVSGVSSHGKRRTH